MTGNPASDRSTDAPSMSDRIRALLATGASAADAVRELGCTLALAYQVSWRMRHPKPPSANPIARGRQEQPDSRAYRVRALLAEGRTPRETADRLGCDIEYVYKVRARVRKKAAKKAGAIAEPAQASSATPAAVLPIVRLAEAMSVFERTRSASEPGPAGKLEFAMRGLVTRARRLEGEVAAIRAALQRVAAVVAEALG